MSSPNSTSTNLTPLARELQEFIVNELISPEGARSITAEDDLIKRGIVDSLGVMQLVDFCESRYGIRVTDSDLVPANFQTLRKLADYVERKQGDQGRRLRFPSRSR
jgi:acyl carrier protein